MNIAHRFSSVVLCLCCAALTTPAPARADFLALAPVAEGSLFQFPTIPDTYQLTPGPLISTAAGLSTSGASYGVYLFDVRALAAYPMSAAALTVHVLDTGGPGGLLLTVAGLASADGTLEIEDVELGVPLLGGGFSAPLPTNLGEVDILVTIDLTDYIRALIADGSPFAALRLGFAGRSGVGNGISVAGTADRLGRGPVLSVVTVPEPASLALAALGGLLATAWGRRARPGIAG